MEGGFEREKTFMSVALLLELEAFLKLPVAAQKIDNDFPINVSGGERLQLSGEALIVIGKSLSIFCAVTGN